MCLSKPASFSFCFVCHWDDPSILNLASLQLLPPLWMKTVPPGSHTNRHSGFSIPAEQALSGHEEMRIQASSLPNSTDRNLGQNHSFFHKRKGHFDRQGSSWDHTPSLEKGLPCVLCHGEWSQQESSGS